MGIQEENEQFLQIDVVKKIFSEHDIHWDKTSREWQFDFSVPDVEVNYFLGAWMAWQAAKASAVPEGFVLVPGEMNWHKADDLACLEWDKHKSLFRFENRDMSALQVEEFRLQWCKNKANKIMSDYKAMIEAQEPSND